MASADIVGNLVVSVFANLTGVSSKKEMKIPIGLFIIYLRGCLRIYNDSCLYGAESFNICRRQGTGIFKILSGDGTVRKIYVN